MSSALAAHAQQITGTPGSPDATVTIDGKQIPPPPLPFGGVIKESAMDSKPYWPPRVVPPKGAPNILLIMTDDQGYGVSSTFGGVIPTPALDRVAKAGLRYTQFHSTALCSPTRAALITGRNHHSVGFGVISRVVHGLPGLRFRHRSGERQHRHDPSRQRLCHVMVWQEPQYAGVPAQRGRPLRPMAVGDGLRVFLRLHGRRDRPVDALSCSAIIPRSSRGSARTDYNLTTDMADEAIKYMSDLNAAAPDKPFFVYYVPGGTHSPHQPKKEWIEKFKGKFDMGYEKLRDADLRQPEEARRDPGEHPTHPVAGRSTAEVGLALLRAKETLRAPGGGLCRLRSLYRP